MIVNLHTHTPRCRHASGTESEYVRAALDADLQTLGFSDHTPYGFPGNYYSHMRMYPHELAEYAETIRSLQAEYAGTLDIPLGVEVEYYPGLFRDLLPRLLDTGIEYMLLGQHWNGNEIGEEYNGIPTEDEQKLSRYCDQIIEAIETGLFTYIAHPDLLHFVGERSIYQRHIRRLCKAAKACNIPMEINLLGFREGRHYPNPLIWEIAAEEGCSVVLGSDAHQPSDVVDPVSEKKVLEIINHFGLSLLEHPNIKKLSL